MNINDIFILKVIAKHESNDNYHSVYGVNKTQPLTTMTIKEVIRWQHAYTDTQGSPSSAAGRYQIIRETLKDLVSKMDISMESLFDKPMQDSMALELLNRRGFQKFLDDEQTLKQTILNLSKEWASLPKDAMGRSYYAGDGLNKAHAKYAEVYEALSNDKLLYEIYQDSKKN